jgi:hypothetical protein
MKALAVTSSFLVRIKICIGVSPFTAKVCHFSSETSRTRNHSKNTSRRTCSLMSPNFAIYWASVIVVMWSLVLKTVRYIPILFAIIRVLAEVFQIFKRAVYQVTTSVLPVSSVFKPCVKLLYDVPSFFVT